MYNLTYPQQIDSNLLIVFSRNKSYLFVSYLIHQLLLLRGVEVKLCHLKGIGLALLFAEAEHDDRGETALHDHLDDLEDFAALGAPLHPSLLAPLVSLNEIIWVIL